MGVILCVGYGVPAQADELLPFWSNPLTLNIPMLHAAPYRVFSLSDPNRVVVDIKEHVWPDGTVDDLDTGTHVSSARVGLFTPAWSRMVLDLATPLRLSVAKLNTGADGYQLTLTFKTT